MRHKKKKLALILWSAVPLACLIYGCIFAVLIWGVITSLAVINRLAFSRNNIQIQPFGAYSEIRNVDVLIIGDMINPCIVVKDGQSYVQIKAPFRNLESCYELVRHTHSILNDENE